MLKIILLILFILSVPLLFLDRICRIYRIEEDLPHARLTLHAASSLPPSLSGLWRTLTTQSRKGRKGQSPISNLRKSAPSADHLFSVDFVISVAKSSSFAVLVSFVVHPLLRVLCALCFALSLECRLRLESGEKEFFLFGQD